MSGGGIAEGWCGGVAPAVRSAECECGVSVVWCGVGWGGGGHQYLEKRLVVEDDARDILAQVRGGVEHRPVRRTVFLVVAAAVAVVVVFGWLVGGHAWRWGVGGVRGGVRVVRAARRRHGACLRSGADPLQGGRPGTSHAV